MEESILDTINSLLHQAMRDGEDSYVEFLQSELHECSENNSMNAFFITPQKQLKYISKITSIFAFPISSQIKCCPFCGFEVDDGMD